MFLSVTDRKSVQIHDRMYILVALDLGGRKKLEGMITNGLWRNFWGW